MIYKFNVKDKRDVKKLTNSKRFPRYPNMFLRNTCEVRINADECLKEDKFTLYSKSNNLPRKIYLYGKKTKSNEESDIYLNYWLNIFLKTVEEGNLCKYDFKKSDSKLELCIGLPLKYRAVAFKYKNWTRKNVIDFLSCLFDCKLEEADYEQQDLLENLMGFIYSLSMGDYFFFIGTVLLIILLVYIIYLIKCGDDEEVVLGKDGFDIEAVCKNIEKNYKPETIKLTSYEEEQENNAIISYDELIKNKDKININYDDEYRNPIPELEVRKISISEDKNENTLEMPKLNVKMFEYEEEENFLKALKELQKDLSH